MWQCREWKRRLPLQLFCLSGQFSFGPSQAQPFWLWQFSRPSLGLFWLYSSLLPRVNQMFRSIYYLFPSKRGGECSKSNLNYHKKVKIFHTEIGRFFSLFRCMRKHCGCGCSQNFRPPPCTMSHVGVCLGVPPHSAQDLRQKRDSQMRAQSHTFRLVA